VSPFIKPSSFIAHPENRGHVPGHINLSALKPRLTGRGFLPVLVLAAACGGNWNTIGDSCEIGMRL
jgi:hypothetical protein